MAERRRRRRLSEEESGEEVTEDIKDTKTRERPSECESEDEHVVEDVEVSDYESVTEGKEPGEENVENEEEEEEDDDDDDDDESEEDSEEDSDEESEESSSEEEEDSDVGVEYADDGLEEERQSGDGEEQPGEDKDKELDDDEDRRNPAYVPRRGAFYEHDTRITEDAEKEQQRLAPKKKLWKDEGKWLHDRFSEDQQAPKSREELMVIYGYDILASDQPPAAAPRINKSRVRNSQHRQQLKDFIGDPKWSGRRTSPDVQQKNYRNRRPARGGGSRSRVGDYGDSRRDYGERHEVIESRRDHGDVRRDYADNRGDSEENGKEPQVERKWEAAENNKRESSEKWHNQEDTKVEPNEKAVNDSHYKKEFSENDSKAVAETKKDHFENRREYVDNRKDYGNNRRDSGNNRRDMGNNRRDSAENRRDYVDNRREYSDNVAWKNYVDRAHNNGEVKSNNGYRSNQKSAPPRQFTNTNYRGENGENTKTDSDNFSGPGYKKSQESNSNYKNIEPNYRGGDSRGHKGNHETSHRNNIIDNRGYRNHENNSGYSYRNNENKQRTPDRNFSNEEVNDSMSKQKGAILNNVEFSGSVVTANNSMEKKSYSKDRRIKGNTRSRMQPVSPHEASVESERNSFSSDNSIQQDGKHDHSSGPSKAENVTRPKRYSTQRQRNLPEVNYPDQIPVDGTTYYSPNFTQGPPPMFHPDQGPPTHQEGAAFQPTMLQAHTPIPYTLPVSTTGIPSPPRLYGPAPVPVSIAAAPPAMLPPQYIGGGVIYGAPPPPGPYQVPVIPGYQSPPPPTAPHTQTAGLQELFRGGTTYYSTDLQQPSPSRSPVRRQKSAIPIINPQDVKNNKKTTSANDTDSNSSSSNSHDKDHEESPAKTTPAVESGDSAPPPTPPPAESNSPKQTVTEETPEVPSPAAVSTSSSSTKSESIPEVVISKEKSSSSSSDDAESNSSSITAHKSVDLPDSCAPSEQATQPILEAAA